MTALYLHEDGMPRRIQTVHIQRPGFRIGTGRFLLGGMGCGSFYATTIATDDPEQVTCGSCKRTVAYRQAVACADR